MHPGHGSTHLEKTQSTKPTQKTQDSNICGSSPSGPKSSTLTHVEAVTRHWPHLREPCGRREAMGLCYNIYNVCVCVFYFQVFHFRTWLFARYHLSIRYHSHRAADDIVCLCVFSSWDVRRSRWSYQQHGILESASCRCENLSVGGGGRNSWVEEVLFSYIFSCLAILLATR